MNITLVEVFKTNKKWNMAVKIDNPISPYHGDVVNTIIYDDSLTRAEAEQLAKTMLTH